MSNRKAGNAICVAVISALCLPFSFVPAHAGPASPYFSESMLEQQDRDQRESKPGGAWNSSEVNVPSYVDSAVNAYGTPVPGLDGVSAGQSVITNQGVPAVQTANAITLGVVGQGGALGAVTGSVGAAPGGFSGSSAANAATGAAFGALKALP